MTFTFEYRSADPSLILPVRETRDKSAVWYPNMNGIVLGIITSRLRLRYSTIRMEYVYLVT